MFFTAGGTVSERRISCCIVSFFVWCWIYVSTSVTCGHRKSLLNLVKCAKHYWESLLRVPFLKCSELARHTSCAKLYHMLFFLINVTNALFLYRWIITNSGTILYVHLSKSYRLHSLCYHVSLNCSDILHINYLRTFHGHVWTLYKILWNKNNLV